MLTGLAYLWLKTETEYVRKLIPLLFLTLLLTACAREADLDPALYSTTKWTEYKVAVVAPLSESQEYKERIERITDWFECEFHDGQKSLEKGVKLKFEWFDETSMTNEELIQLGRSFAARSDLAAVVGPFYSQSVDAVASKIYQAGIPMFVPVTTSEDVQRRYSVSTTGRIRSPFMWCMSESDVAQSEVLMGMISSYGYDSSNPDAVPSVALVAPDDLYGKTFTEWIPYHAVGMNEDLKDNIQYQAGDRHSIAESVDRLAESHAGYAVVASATASDSREFVRAVRAKGHGMPRLLFSDVTFNASFLTDPGIAESAEGVTMYADPESGFAYAYQAKFGELPTPDECMLYDALLLAGMSCEYSLMTGVENLNSIVAKISSAENDAPAVTAWNSLGIQQYLSACMNDSVVSPLRGVSGILRFDSESFTSRVASTYAMWRVFEGKFVIMAMVSTENGDSKSKWESMSHYRNTFLEFDRDVRIEYGPMKDRWALLVCGSGGWENYRHAADVLGVYQFLKEIGYDDSHIILVFSDGISGDARNIHPGEIRGTSEGNNLLDGVCVDYRQTDITPQDICDILLGQSSGRIPTVLETDSCSNVFVYWSGHGFDGGFNWDGGGAMTAEMLGNTVSEMSARRLFRKLLFVAEPCHSSSVLSGLESYRGVLGLASAYATESSFADVYDAEMGTWLSDRFTNNFISYLKKYTEFYIYWELYNFLREHTIGSHVNVINSSCYDNLYDAGFKDFFFPEL